MKGKNRSSDWRDQLAHHKHEPTKKGGKDKGGRLSTRKGFLRLDLQRRGGYSRGVTETRWSCLNITP